MDGTQRFGNILSLASVGRMLIDSFGTLGETTVAVGVPTFLAMNRSRMIAYFYAKPQTLGAAGQTVHYSTRPDVPLRMADSRLANNVTLEEFEAILRPGQSMNAVSIVGATRVAFSVVVLNPEMMGNMIGGEE